MIEITVTIRPDEDGPDQFGDEEWTSVQLKGQDDKKRRAPIHFTDPQSALKHIGRFVAKHQAREEAASA